MGELAPLTGPDLMLGIADAEVREGAPLLGHAEGEAVLLVREGATVHAVSATCTHYGAPLADGIVEGGKVRCPWHHACFDLASGRAHGPALAPLACWEVRHVGGRLSVLGKRPAVAPAQAPRALGAGRVVIVGGGAAGVACAEALRREGHAGTITMIVAEGSDPVDRPNLSKDYLAGAAPEEWVFLRTSASLGALGIDLVEGPAAALELETRTVRLVGARATGVAREIGWDALLLATGAEPIRLAIDGAELPHVHTLRTLADSRAIIAVAAAAGAGARAVVIGSSFLGLEAAAALRARGVEVTVVAPEPVPLARVLGEEVGAFVRRVHERNGVAFRLGRTPARITRDEVVLDDGTLLPAQLVVMGVGVRPRLTLAEGAGLKIDHGVVVDEELRAAPTVWAAGDIARWPFRGARVRVEHWQVATRQGQAVARSMLGQPPARDVPFFWTAHHDVTIGYVGHAERFDVAEVHGDLEAREAHVVYRDAGRIVAVATLGRDRLALEVEVAMEHDDARALEAIVGPPTPSPAHAPHTPHAPPASQTSSR
jgi:NADPH-dependent 2,4-dienoyl-CoA reductase/sulfur reductase-like enzyme/nitrite reductase/ring-hydroxylating ferredoxin subunit